MGLPWAQLVDPQVQGCEKGTGVGMCGVVGGDKEADKEATASGHTKRLLESSR